MFSDTVFWRLVWKEYRTHRALWLVMAAFPPLVEGLILVVARALSRPPFGTLDDDQASALMVIGFLASLVYVLGCSATIFSVEHQNATFDFQRVLPASYRRVLSAKVGFAAVSGLLLTFLLWLVIRVLILGFL